ncbi:hypothetical protein ANCCEY_01204 [Ancylostoma ceylanicum]|uniref:CKK domain-containing protein n=1 Tax=Ancylostoma ceylanicum TaxID=53326 RepID=A0A0D6M6A7_9BILA|nr:hypothetical protein ANCCEY_01204 [Ancylostoma ceylanicum]
MEEDILPPLTPLDQYLETEGKLAASIRWLILRVYEQEKDIPDKLRHGAFRDERGHLQLDVAILTGLTNGSLYSQAAAKIFKEPQLVAQSHGAVLAALIDYGIDVVHCADGGTSPVTENALFSVDNFNMAAHLAMMDALMLAHLRNVITVGRVIDAVSRHTTVDESERPMDSVDALLFWINKVCLLVRDDVERSQIQLKDICYNDQMSTAHCHYNLLLLQRFCHNSLPWNPFHFEIEDILYLHDSLQMNINVFLADLFEIFEPAPTVVQPEPVTSPRRFVPIQGIPDLRSANSAARNPHPPRVRNPFSNVHVTSTGGVAMPSRSVSMMSQDSLLTNRTMTESERAEKGKAAFFAIMSRCDASNASASESPNAKMIRELDRKLTDLAQQVSYMNMAPDQQRMSRALSQPSVYQAQGAQNYAQPYAQQQQQQQDFYNYAQPQGHYAQPQQLRSSLSNGMLNYLPGQAPSYGEYPTGLVQPHQMQPPPGYTTDPYSAHPGSYMQQQPQQQGYPMMHQSAHAATGFSLHQPSAVGMAPMMPPASTYSTVQAMPPSLDTHNTSSSYALQHQPAQLISTAGMMPAQQQQLYSQPYSSYQGTPQLENQPPLDYESHEGVSTFRLHSQDDQAQRQSPCPIGAVPRRSRDSREGSDAPQAPEPERVRVQEHQHRQDLHLLLVMTRRLRISIKLTPAPSGPAFVVSDDQAAEDFDKIAEQRRQAKRAALLAKTMKRKEEIENKVDQIEQRNAEKRLAEMAKREMAEQRKLEKELQRQKILDDYKRRKMEKELGVESGSNSARGPPGRGHSQPPFIRTKSQMSESALGTDGSDKGRPPRMRGQSTVEQRISVSSLQEPTHKLFAKAAPKSNRGLIINALQYSVFPGAVNDQTRMKTMNDLAASDAKHFLILFRDYKCQYRGLYSWDQI